MAIFKPETSNGTFTDYHGICEFGLLGFKDKSGDFDWADMFIEVQIQQKDSDYESRREIYPMPFPINKNWMIFK